MNDNPHIQHFLSEVMNCGRTNALTSSLGYTQSGHIIQSIPAVRGSHKAYITGDMKKMKGVGRRGAEAVSVCGSRPRDRFRHQQNTPAQH